MKLLEIQEIWIQGKTKMRKAGLIRVRTRGGGKLAVNRCDVKWPLIYPWIAGLATLGNYFTARYGGLRLAYVPRSHTRNVAPRI